MPDNILIEQPADGVGLIRIHRPERRNALNTATLAEIAAALDDFAADESIRVVILTGDDRAFAAGADVTEMQGKSPVEALANLRARYWDAVRFFPKPIIAAVSGWCLGGGNELAMACDMIVASETAQFGQPEINLAIIPGAGGTQRLTHVVGKALTMEMVLAGRFLTAHEARDLGLVNAVYPVELYLKIFSCWVPWRRGGRRPIAGPPCPWRGDRTPTPTASCYLGVGRSGMTRPNSLKVTALMAAEFSTRATSFSPFLPQIP